MAEEWGAYVDVTASRIKPEYDSMVKAMRDQERKVKESELINDNNFIEASKRIYRWDTGQDFTGSKQDLVNYGLDKVSSIDFNTVDFATNTAKIYNAQKEDQIAYLYLLDTVSDKDITWNGFKRGIKNVVSDPTLYLGFGAGKILGKAAQETAQEGVKLSLMKSIQAKIASETGTAAMMGAGYTGAYDLGTQGVEVKAGMRPNIDIGELATNTAVGGAVGASIPKVISGIGQGIKKGAGQINQWAKEGEQLAMQQAGGGTPLDAKDYRMEHKAPRPEGSNIGNDVRDVWGEDMYKEPKAYQWYGHGENTRLDKKAVEVIKSMKDNPDKEITIYRAVPKGVSDINKGDWITTVKEYATEHGKSYLEKFDVISKKVKAKDIATDGNSIFEWGYYPENDAAKGLRTKDEQLMMQHAGADAIGYNSDNNGGNQ